MGKTLTIQLDEQVQQEKGIARYRLSDGERQDVLWFKCDERYDDYIMRDRCDCAVVALFASAMKAGYERIESDLPISQRLYYSLNNHVIPQFYVASRKRLPEMQVKAPVTTEAFQGEKVCTGMTCGIDSFSTLYEYGRDFEPQGYRINALTLYRAGAFGHSEKANAKVLRMRAEEQAAKAAVKRAAKEAEEEAEAPEGEASSDAAAEGGLGAVGADGTLSDDAEANEPSKAEGELPVAVADDGSAPTEEDKFKAQLSHTRAFCDKYGYELIVVESNLDDILVDWFGDIKFIRTQTSRNVAMTLFLQKLIRTYYYSAGYNVTNFKLSPNINDARYEKWLLPLVGTESTSFMSAGKNWSRLEKLQRLVDFEECHGFLQACLNHEGISLQCTRCKCMLMQLDVLGDDALDKFKGLFDIRDYKRTCRTVWFRDIFSLKDDDSPYARYYDELFMYALEHRPELIGKLVRASREGVGKVKARMHGVVRLYPSKLSGIVAEYDAGQTFPYRGESGIWVAVALPDGSRGFVQRQKTSLWKLAPVPERNDEPEPEPKPIAVARRAKKAMRKAAKAGKKALRRK